MEGNNVSIMMALVKTINNKWTETTYHNSKTRLTHLNNIMRPQIT